MFDDKLKNYSRNQLVCFWFFPAFEECDIFPRARNLIRADKGRQTEFLRTSWETFWIENYSHEGKKTRLQSRPRLLRHLPSTLTLTAANKPFSIPTTKLQKLDKLNWIKTSQKLQFYTWFHCEHLQWNVRLVVLSRLFNSRCWLITNVEDFMGCEMICDAKPILVQF